MIRKLLNKIKTDDNLRYIFSSGGVSFVFKLFGIIFGFLVIWLISKLFDEKYYGTFALLQVIVQLLVLVFTFGLTSILVKEINKKKDEIEFHHTFLLQILRKISLISLFPSLILFFGSKYISSSIFLKENLTLGFQIMGIGLVFYLLHELTLYFFIARKDFVKFGLFMFVMPNVFFIALIFIFQKHITNENHLFFIYSLSFFLCFIIEILLIFAKNKMDLGLKMEWKSIFKESNPIMLSNLTVYLISNVSILFLGRFVSESDLGIFNAASKLGLSVLIVIQTINIIIAPKVADLFHNNKLDDLKKFIQKSTHFIIITTIPLAIFVIFFNKSLLSLFGAGYIHGSSVLIIITLATFLNAGSGNIDQILNMTGNQKILFKINLATLIFTIIINSILIPKFGINGAAIATLISTAFMNIAGNIIIKLKLGYYTFL